MDIILFIVGVLVSILMIAYGNYKNKKEYNKVVDTMDIQLVSLTKHKDKNYEMEYKIKFYTNINQIETSVYIETIWIPNIFPDYHWSDSDNLNIQRVIEFANMYKEEQTEMVLNYIKTKAIDILELTKSRKIINEADKLWEEL